MPEDKKEDLKEWFVLPGLNDVFIQFVKLATDYLSAAPKFYDKPLLIIGDSGTGKSLFTEVAKKIFSNLNEKNKERIVRINCASFTKDLSDSELFGHIKGAYTGAIRNKIGIVEEYENGLVILDEIGELSPEIQAKLLVFIEEGEYRRLGEEKIKHSNVKIIGTTNRRKEYFRDDFWYRFFPIFVPSLHERRLDILYYISLKHKDILERLVPQQVLRLLAHNWPGNMRELERVILLVRLYDPLKNEEEHYKIKKNLFNDILFPTDSRQTLLANDTVNSISKKLISEKFDLSLFNSIILKYGLQIPYYFENLSDLIDACIPIYKRKSPDKDLSTLESLKASKDKYEQIKKYDKGISDFIWFVHDAINNGDRFYKNNSNKFNVSRYYSEYGLVFNNRNDSIEKIGSCFSCISKIFLTNFKSADNIFSLINIEVQDTLWDDELEAKLMKKFIENNFIQNLLNIMTNSKVIINKQLNFDESWKTFIERIIKDNKEAFYQFHPDKQNEKNNNYDGYDENTLLYEYYKYLLNREKTIKKAHVFTGLDYETFRSRLRKLRQKGFDFSKDLEQNDSGPSLKQNG